MRSVQAFAIALLRLSILNAHTDLSLVFYHYIKDNQFKCHFEILQIAHSPEGRVEDHRTQNLLERGREVTDYPPICNGHIVRSTGNLNESSSIFMANLCLATKMNNDIFPNRKSRTRRGC